MCQLVTIGFPKGFDPRVTVFGEPRDGLAVTPSRNPHVAGIFPKTDLRFDVTIGGCSCDLIGGRHGARAGDGDNQRRRYEKLGWSRAKIDRALEASAAAQGRARRVGRAERAGTANTAPRPASVRDRASFVRRLS